MAAARTNIASFAGWSTTSPGRLRAGVHREAALTRQPDTGKQTTSRIGVAKKNNNFCGND